MSRTAMSLWALLVCGACSADLQDECRRDTDCGDGQVCSVGVCVERPDVAPKPDGAPMTDGAVAEAGVPPDEGTVSPPSDGAVSPPDGSPGCQVVSVEVCNGLDDDCDGRTDEPEDLPCQPPRGCVGHLECAGGRPPQCVVDHKPEICDGVDNDCNGITDDGHHPCCRGNVPVGQAACGQRCSEADTTWEDC